MVSFLHYAQRVRVVKAEIWLGSKGDENGFLARGRDPSLALVPRAPAPLGEGYGLLPVLGGSRASIDSARAHPDNGLMRRLLITSLAAILGLGCIVLAIPPQDKKLPPPGREERVPYKPPSAWKSVEIGNFYLRRKDYPGALSRFQEAVQTDPHYPGGYLGMGKVYEKLGSKLKALDAYRKYLDLLPSTKDALEAKDVQKAVARLERATAPKGKSSTTTADHR